MPKSDREVLREIAELIARRTGREQMEVPDMVLDLLVANDITTEEEVETWQGEGRI